MSDPDPRPAPSGDGTPAGTPYDWYVRGTRLLESGNPQAAAQVLAHLVEVEPTSPTVLEAWARALFDAQRYDDAADAFEALVERVPDDDYAHFGLGMARWRQRRFTAAADHLAVAAVMRPDRAEYARALGQVRATLRAREEAGLAPDGDADPPTTHWPAGPGPAHS